MCLKNVASPNKTRMWGPSTDPTCPKRLKMFKSMEMYFFEWIEYYSIPTALNENAFIGLIALSPSNDISTSQL